MSEQGLAGMIAAVGRLDQRVDDATRIDRIRLLEQLKAAAAAAQAVEAAAFATSQRAAQAIAGLPADRVGRGVAAQVGLARRISPHAAARYVSWATILTRELPRTLAELTAGRTSERRAMLVARETVFLSREHRASVDSELAPQLQQLGDKRTEAAARKLAYRLDPAGFVAHARAAEHDRRVSIRPAPDAMARLTALLPVAQGVACYAALSRAADTTTAGGDDRGRGQLMADTLVQRITGQRAATDVPVAVNLVMTDTSLLGPSSPGGAEPAHLDGYGPIPAHAARDLITRPDRNTPMSIRRLYTHPRSGQLIAMESRRRAFTPAQREFVRLRDQHCRTPYCDAPIRHTDHVVSHRQGGPTHVRNAQGGCEACNYAKEAPGWHADVIPAADGRHHVRITTPTGHTYTSTNPDPPGAGPAASLPEAARHTDAA
jgi:hypothetical protein